MYIERVPNRNSPPAILLREGRREGGKVVKRTLVNLSHWPAVRIAALEAVLKGHRDAPAASPVEWVTERSLPHGHVEVIAGMIRRLGLDTLIASEPSHQRDLVVAMVTERLLHPGSKLATTRLWSTTTLAEEMGVAGADVDELYEALDWLLARQKRIETKLAARHLRPGGRALYDVSSSYYEGRHCVLAHYGYDRDGSKGRPIIVYGMMTNDEGCPVGIRVYPGNTSDPATVSDQIERLRREFGLSHMTLVGDRGMLTHARIEALKAYPQLGWVSALRAPEIRKLVDAGAIQLSLFDTQNLAEIASPDFPGERLVVCHNPLLAEERGRKREELLAATEQALAQIQRAVNRRTKKPMTAQEISLKAGPALKAHKMGKHFTVTIGDGRFEFARDLEAIKAEARLDGLYVIRTCEPEKDLAAADTVRAYKDLAHVERAFRTLKGPDLSVRPVFLRDEAHVRAHFFLCMLAYYVEWHMRRAWAPLLFDDEQLAEDRRRRDPVAPAQASDSARHKKKTRRTQDGHEVQSFKSLLALLGTRCRVRYRQTFPGKQSDPFNVTYDDVTEPTPLQKRAFDLLELFPEVRKSK